MIYFSESIDKTKSIAAGFAKMLSGGQKIALVGELGAGKTAFTQGLVSALGSPDRVKSPTYTIINEYQITNHPTIKTVIHADFYRFSTEADLSALELETYLSPNTIIIVEWPNAIPLFDLKFDFTVTISHDSAGRTINIEP